MSADIIPFIPRRRRKRDLAYFPDPAAMPGDLVMDHVDTSPCEYVWPDADDPASGGNVDVQDYVQV